MTSLKEFRNEIIIYAIVMAAVAEVVSLFIIGPNVYGAVFFICIKASLPCGFGCGIGFVTIHFGIMFLYGIVYKFIKKKKNPLNDWTEPKEWNDLSVYDDEDDWPTL